MSSVRGISISKTRTEFFNLQRFGDGEFRIQTGLVNTRIKKFTKKFRNGGKSPPKTLGTKLIVSCKACGASDHPELHSPGFADHVLIPRRVPNQLHISFIHAVDAENFALCIMGDSRSHSTTRRGQSHFYFDARSSVVLLSQTAIVNQTEINDVDRDLRIVALAQLIPDVFF